MSTPKNITPSRRRFLKLAAGITTAATALPTLASRPSTNPATTPATTPGRARGRGPGAAPLPPLPNGDSPAMVFQPYPGGTAAYLQKTLKEKGAAAFDPKPIEIEPWNGPVPTAEEDIAFLPVHRLAHLIQSKKLSPIDLTRIYLDRLKKYDPTLLCAVTIMEGPAKEAAQQADADIKAGRYKGPLHGIPWGCKDLFATKKAPTTWGADEFKTRQLDFDAEIVQRLEAAGAILIAKLATGRFAMGDQWYRGRTNNPWNTAAGSSGSSAGPGSATAAACVAFSIGTETRGSITSPASTCGITALRPTYGRVSRHGGMVLAWTMDRVGPMCRSAFDCALVFNAIHGLDEKDNSTLTAPFAFNDSPDLSKLRIGIDASAPAAFVEKLRELGANPTPLAARPTSRLDSINPESASAFSGDFTTGTLQDVDAPNGTRRDPAGPPNEGRFTVGRNPSAFEFLNTQRHRLKLIQQMADIMKNVDLYISQGDLGDTTLTSMTGHPCVVLPYNFAVSGRGRGNTPPQPQCTFMVGNLYQDDTLLSVAHAYQKATDFHARRPTINV